MIHISFSVCHTCHQYAKGKSSNTRGYGLILQVTFTSPLSYTCEAPNQFQAVHYTKVLHLTLKETKFKKNFSTEQSFCLFWKGHEAGVLFLKYTTADF